MIVQAKTTSKKSTITLAVAPTIQIVLATCLLSAGKADMASDNHGASCIDGARGDMRDQEIRAALDRHWAASDASDFEAEHAIYREDAVLEYPQSGERIRGRRNIQITRAK